MSKKPKLLHTMTWLAKGGGVDNNVLLSIEGLKQEFECHFAVGKEIHYNAFREVEGLKLFVCPDLVRPISPFRDIRAIWYFYRLIRKEKYDIVHTHETKASFITRIAAWLAGCDCIIYGLHGVTFNDPMSRWKRSFYILLEKLTIRMNHYIIGVSRDVIDHYHRNNIGKQLPFSVIYSGIDVERFEQDALKDEGRKQALKAKLNIRPEEQVITNVGRFSFSKAQRYTIESFARLKRERPHIKLLLVGEGELLDNCKEQVADLGLESDVIFYGFTDKVAEVLSLSDVFVLTSLREGLPRVVVEAALCKVPAVAFEVEGIREIIEHGKSGYIVPQYDVDGLTDRIGQLLNDDRKRHDFAESAYRHASVHWDAKAMVSGLRETYHNCLNGKHE